MNTFRSILSLALQGLAMGLGAVSKVLGYLSTGLDKLAAMAKPATE